MNRLLGILLIGALVGLVTGDNLFAAVHENVSYKPEASSDYEKSRCRLDLHLPDGVEGFPTVVWFHGGSIQSGDKAGEIARGIARRLNAHGVALASVNYRLSPAVTFPEYLIDASAAVAWVIRNIEGHGGAPNLVFVSGHSAGGYLAAMVGLDEVYLRRHGIRPLDLAGVIPVAGQMVTHSTVREERGISRTTPIIDAAAPSFHVRSNTPPFLNIVADADLPARVEENTYFVAAMKAAGNESVHFLKIEDRDHGSVAANISNEGDPALKGLLEFIERNRE